MDTATLMTGLSAGRIAVGLAHLVAPGAAGKGWYGPVAAEPGGSVAVRTFAIREIFVGAATLGTIRATGTSGTGFKVLTGLGIAVDVVDAAATASALADLPRTAKAVLAVAVGAAATGALALATSD